MSLNSYLRSWSAVSANRALVYRWLANVLAWELDESQLRLYQAGGAQGVFTLLEAIGLGDEVARVQRAMAQWSSEVSPVAVAQSSGADAPNATDDADAQWRELRLELAADFAQLFLLDAKQACVPYASAYVDGGQLYGTPTQLMRQLMQDNGLALPDTFKEPEDHVSVILMVLAQWIERAADHTQCIGDGQAQVVPADTMRADTIQQRAKAQADFLQAMVLNFVPEFVRRSQSIPVRSDFYPAICALVLAFVQADYEYLLAVSQEP